ncbi:alcohol dehydrogenase [Fusarium acutatum]|uniref:Alcohol dehydrogenase n=1 Tax=Fusarium acutatum TaxID=78861 RepID=A0A8H4J9K0_9HYPO|nr:alcohol dehydrogenase [Fusarium acutatum]
MSTSKSPAERDMPKVGKAVLKLNDGNNMPMLGYGLGTVLHKRSRDQKNDAIVTTTKLAIEHGFRHLDCAELYNNEKELGDAVRASPIPRSDLFIVTKLCGTEKRDVKAEFQGSLSRLGLTYVDLYLVHAPYMADNAKDLQHVWSQMEEIKRSGRAKSIGVSNFLQEHIETILETAEIPPAVNSIEYHPYLQRRTLIDFLKSQNIAVSAYSTLAALTEEAPGPVSKLYTQLACKYDVTETDIALRWCLDQNIAAITTSRKGDRLKALSKNMPTFELTKAEIDSISLAGQAKHYRKFLTDRFAPEDRR